MALNKYANTSNARDIFSTCQHIEASARKCNISLRSSAHCKEGMVLCIGKTDEVVGGVVAPL